MLVLNTNEQWSSWNVLSNSMIRAYPDFKSLLFYPNISTYKNFTYDNINATWDDVFFTNASTIWAFSINWTKVDVESQILLEDMLLIWWQNWQTIWSNLYVYWYWNYNIPSSVPNWKWTRVFRFWFSEILEWWEIIWKKITTNFWFCFGFGQWSYIYNKWTFIFWIVYRVWLLHSDWSITYWDWIENDEYKTNEYIANDSTARYFWNSIVNKTNETNWLTAVAGDRVIFEIGSRITYTNNTWVWYISRDTYLYFWKRWTPNNVYVQNGNYWTTTDLRWTWYLWWDMRWRPIQISIE